MVNPFHLICTNIVIPLQIRLCPDPDVQIDCQAKNDSNNGVPDLSPLKWRAGKCRNLSLNRG